MSARALYAEKLADTFLLLMVLVPPVASRLVAVRPSKMGSGRTSGAVG